MPNCRTMLLLAASAALALVACDRFRGEDARDVETEGPPRGVVFPPDGPHQAGPQPVTGYVAARNPYEGDRQALRDGERFYMWYNCHGCHGALGGGGIGPPLRDADWIYGGDPASIYQSIYQGRPNGMPAYGGIAPEELIWKIAAYVQALARGDDVGPSPMRPAGLDASPDANVGVGAPARRGATDPPAQGEDNRQEGGSRQDDGRSSGG